MDPPPPCPELGLRPYLLTEVELESILSILAAKNFRTVFAHFDGSVNGAESGLLEALTSALGLEVEGVGSWAAFNDRMWDVLSDYEEQPIVVVLRGMDDMLRADTYSFANSIHRLLSMTEGTEAVDHIQYRQFEYLFVGRWGSPSGG